MIKRQISDYLLSLTGKYPVVTITGPRQSGKTTLARAVFKEKDYINLELPDIREYARTDPRGFLNRIPDGAIIDEIQRVPELSSYIQGVVDDRKQNGMFILTGSQQFELTNSITQSLAGRTALLKLLPFSLYELRHDIDFQHVDESIYKGFYPRIYDQNLNATQAMADYFKGIRIFEKIIPAMPYGKIVIYGGNHPESRDDIKIIPLSELSGILKQIN